MATDHDIDRVRPRFMAGKCRGGRGLEYGTSARVYHDRCEEILEVVKAGGTHDFIGDIQESILHDPYRYPAERQRWWVDHYHVVAKVLWQRGRRVRVRGASGKCLVVKADQVYPSREVLEKAARKGG